MNRQSPGVFRGARRAARRLIARPRMSAGGVLIILLGAGASSLAAALEAGANFDVVALKNGHTRRVRKITIENYLYVGGRQGKFRACDVKNVYRDEVPSEIASGSDYFQRGEYRAAAYYYVKALESKKMPKWAREYGAYYAGLAFFKNGDFLPNGYVGRKSRKQYPPTSALLAKVWEINPKSRFLLTAVVRWVEALAKEGKYSQAEAAYKEAKKKIAAYRADTQLLNENYEKPARKALVRLALAWAEALELREKAKGKNADWDEVLDAYRRAQRNTADYPESAWRASEGEIRMLVKLKDYDAASDIAQRVLDKAGRGDLSAGQVALLPAAYTTLGTVHYRKAMDAAKAKYKNKALKEYAEARWNFLQVVVQFADSSTQSAKAAFFAAECFYQLRDYEPDALNTAKQYWAEVARKYPGGTWAKAAQARLDATAVTGEEKKAPAVEKSEEKKAASKKKIAG